MIRITAKRSQGFWRCGVFHVPTATDHPDDRFSKEELERLKAEPHLLVEEIAEADKASRSAPAAEEKPEEAPAAKDKAPKGKGGKR